MIKNAPEFINNQQFALISRNINIVQVSSIAAATTRRTVLLTKGTSNHESESLIQNTPASFINDQHLASISRHDTTIQASRLAVVKSRKTGAMNHLNSNHKSESLVRNAPEILPTSHLPDILKFPKNFKQHAHIARYYYNIAQASRLAAEPLRKTGMIVHLQGNKESGSLIRNAHESSLESSPPPRHPEKYEANR